MSLWIQRIQNALIQVDYSLFEIKDLTFIVATYAISSPTKVLHHKAGLNPWEVKLSHDGILAITTKYGYDDRQIEFFTVSADGFIKPTEKTPIRFVTLRQSGFDIDVNRNKLMVVSQGNDSLEIINLLDMSVITVMHFETTPYDVVMDFKNNAFYVLMRGKKELTIGDLPTNAIVEEKIMLDNRATEIKLLSSLNLLAIRSPRSIIVYQVPDFTMKFKIDLEDERSNDSCMCFSLALNSVVVALFGQIAFYSLETGLERKEMRVDLRMSLVENSCDGANSECNGLAYDETNGFLIMSVYNFVLVIG